MAQYSNSEITLHSLVPLKLLKSLPNVNMRILLKKYIIKARNKI